MMIAFITWNSSLVPMIEGLCSSNAWELSSEGINSPSLGPTKPRLHVSSWVEPSQTPFLAPPSFLGSDSCT